MTWHGGDWAAWRKPGSLHMKKPVSLFSLGSWVGLTASRDGVRETVWKDVAESGDVELTASLTRYSALNASICVEK